MRELFDEVAGHSPLDPEEAVRRAARRPQRKRFYAQVGVAETPKGFGITLDGKPARTPSRRLLAAPTRENLQRLGGLLADGTLRVPIQTAYELDQAADALTALPTTHTQGKIAIRVH